MNIYWIALYSSYGSQVLLWKIEHDPVLMVHYQAMCLALSVRLGLLLYVWSWWPNGRSAIPWLFEDALPPMLHRVARFCSILPRMIARWHIWSVLAICGSQIDYGAGVPDYGTLTGSYFSRRNTPD